MPFIDPLEKQDRGMEFIDPLEQKSEGTITKAPPWWMRDVVKPTLEYGGMTVGAAIPTIAGLAAPPAAAAAIPMAGAGYALGKRTYETLESGLYGTKEPNQPAGNAVQTLKDIKTGMTMEALGQVGGPILSKVFGKLKGTEEIINKGIEKGVRPSVVGKKTYEQVTKYSEKSQDAVKTIIDNKQTLALTDEVGNTIKGELPKNLKQFSQSINQVKRKIFLEYDAMAQASGKTANVNLKPIAKELDIISNNKVVRDLSPDVAEYASTRSKAFNQSGSYSTTETQDAIAHLNNSLEAFHKNPSYENASKASIDAMIANRLRKSLDSEIENAVGKGYQQLKNKYGALSEIEKDVTHRAIVDARKNIKGLIDFSDIFSGSEVVHGILTMNPGRVGAGVAAKTIASIYRFMNDPNVIIRKMFEKAEKSIIAGSKQRVSEETGKRISTGLGYAGLALSQSNEMEQ